MFVLQSTGRYGLTTFVSNFVSPAIALFFMALVVIPSVSRAQPTVEQALQYVPVQKDVPYDTPAAKDFAKCTVKAEDRDGASALVMRGPAGQILRSFDDTNKDNRVDRWCYFQNGMESYRDVDSNFNGKADQHRWLGFAGTKWAVDRNEDGNIDSWKEISAEEVSAEIVSAVRDGDVERFATVLLKPAELQDLGLSADITKVMAERLGTATRRFQAAARGQNLVTKNSQWVHFSASRPAVLPAGSGGADKDVYIYENVAAMLDKGQLPVGTLVRANGQWRAVDVPTGLMDKEEQNQFGSFLLTPPAAAPPGAAPEGGMNEATQKLVKELAKNDAAIRAESDAAKRDALYDRQVIVLRELANANKDEQEMWIKQLAETLGTSVQSGEYSKGLAQLQNLNKEVSGQAKGTPLAAYVGYRAINAEYATKLKNPKGDFPKVQAWWTEQLETFVKDNPKGPDFTEAMLQLATAEELAGHHEVAVKNYEAIIANGEGELKIAKAKGAKLRLTSVGNVLNYGGNSITGGKPISTADYKKKHVLLHFWATWCQPCVGEMKKLERMRQFYAPDFEVIGVNVDTDEKALQAFLKGNPPKWPMIYERGGFESKPATDLGILTVPTRILIGPKGEVVKNSADLNEVQNYLDKRLNNNAN